MVVVVVVVVPVVVLVIKVEGAAVVLVKVVLSNVKMIIKIIKIFYFDRIIIVLWLINQVKICVSYPIKSSTKSNRNSV